MQYFLCQKKSIQFRMWFSERIVTIHMTPKIFFRCWKVIWSLCDCRNCRFLSADAPDFWAIPLATFLAGRSPSPGWTGQYLRRKLPRKKRQEVTFWLALLSCVCLSNPQERSKTTLLISHVAKKEKNVAPQKISTRMNRKKLWPKKSKHLSWGLHKWREI